MVEYSSIVKHKGKVCMFSCGNNNRDTGFGYAVLKHW
jgi:hypothetical protein